MYQTKEQLPVPESAVGFGWFAQAVQLAKYNKKRKLVQNNGFITECLEWSPFQTDSAACSVILSNPKCNLARHKTLLASALCLELYVWQSQGICRAGHLHLQ